MEKLKWTNSDIRKLFHMGDRFKSIQTLYNAEERGEIPKADRIARGKVSTRVWDISQLPEIGKKYGFLPLPTQQQVICKYIPKGGVAKTSTSYNEARTFALNGMKTLIVGLDSELSITDIQMPHEEPARLDDIESPLGLYHFFCEGASFEEIKRETILPTLDIIPETHDLSLLEKWIDREKRREYIFRDKLLPALSEYDVIIFDNCPYWSHLVTNSIVCSTAIVIPLGCNLLAFNSSSSNISNIFDFQEEMQLTEQKTLMFSTMLERSSLSQQINATYLSTYSDFIMSTPIRKSVKWEEALLNQQTILEYAPTSQQAEEYFYLISEVWDRMNQVSKTSHESIDTILEIEA